MVDPIPRKLVRFLRFAGLSGLGWAADTGILLGLVHLGLRPFLANLTSSSVAALSVFLLSRETVFRKADGSALLRAAIYLVYTVAMICAASVCLALLVTAITALAAQLSWSPTALGVALAAKVLVTPPQLLLNFLVSQLLSEREMRKRSTVLG